jgi:hypothetical protein
MMGKEEDYDEDEKGFGILGLAADAISVAKDLLGALWNR